MNTTRDTKNGQYAHSTLEAVCTCYTVCHSLSAGSIRAARAKARKVAVYK